MRLQLPCLPSSDHAEPLIRDGLGRGRRPAARRGRRHPVRGPGRHDNAGNTRTRELHALVCRCDALFCNAVRYERVFSVLWPCACARCAFPAAVLSALRPPPCLCSPDDNPNTHRVRYMRRLTPLRFPGQTRTHSRRSRALLTGSTPIPVRSSAVSGQRPRVATDRLQSPRTLPPGLRPFQRRRCGVGWSRSGAVIRPLLDLFASSPALSSSRCLLSPLSLLQRRLLLFAVWHLLLLLPALQLAFLGAGRVTRPLQVRPLGSVTIGNAWCANPRTDCSSSLTTSSGLFDTLERLLKRSAHCAGERPVADAREPTRTQVNEQLCVISERK